MFRKIHIMQKTMTRMTNGIELAVSLLVIAGIVFYLTGLPSHFMAVPSEGLGSYLQYLFDILIAVELIRLLCYHELTSMVEVLMFAVSRQVIIGHQSLLDNLIAVLSITILFAVRKFLFIHKETYDEEAKRRSGLL